MPGAVSRHVGVIAAGLVLYGIGLSAWNSGVIAYRQDTLPAHVYGRATMSYRLVSWGASPIGAAAGGVLATALPLRAVLALALAFVASQILVLPMLDDLRAYRGGAVAT